MFCHGGRMFCQVGGMFCNGGRMFCHGGGMFCHGGGMLCQVEEMFCHGGGMLWKYILPMVTLIPVKKSSPGWVSAAGVL